jgi:hypothetical protein
MYDTTHENGVLVCSIHRTPISKSHGRFFCLKCQHSEDYHKQHNTEEHQAKIGNCIAQLVLLKKHKNRYHTAWGTKTDLGLYLSVKRIFDEERINI